MSDADQDLLRRFARDHAQDAFTEIVRRHVNLIFSAARRQVRSPQLAEEVAQSVFSDLARNAEKLCAADSLLILTAWLYQVAHHTAVDVVRRESRRQLREQIAAEMNAMNTTEAAWPDLEPFLDEAMQELEPDDRAAVLLRYFENQSFRDVGARLGLSEDAAQKRVSRAVEKLRDCFSRRKIVVGAGGLIALVSANAVQSAPIGLAAAIAAAALAGTAATTSTVIVAAKTIAMTTLQKTLITAAVAVLAGAGIYQAKQAHDARAEVKTLQQQQAPLAEQIRQLQGNYSDVTNRLDNLLAENSRLQSSSNEAELLKLRGEVTQLRAIEAQRKSDSMQVMADAWIKRVDTFKQYVADHPDDGIPEFQFLTDREWLSVVDPSYGESDFKQQIESLKGQAIGRFAGLMQGVLQKYEQANSGQFPSDLSQLQPYCDANVETILLQRYEIKPASILPAATTRDLNVKTDWVIAGKQAIASNTADHIAIWADGESYFWH